MKEIWKDVVGYEGLYQVSNLGRVRSLTKWIQSKGLKSSHLKSGVILTPQKTNLGYLRVGLYLNKKYKPHLIHRLMAIVFITNHLNKPQVNHINGIKSDNRLENLEWCTASENRIHSHVMGLQKPKCGEENHYAKLTNKDVLAIRSGKKRGYEYAKKYGVSGGTISLIRSRKTWAHV